RCRRAPRSAQPYHRMQFVLRTQLDPRRGQGPGLAGFWEGAAGWRDGLRARMMVAALWGPVKPATLWGPDRLRARMMAAALVPDRIRIFITVKAGLATVLLNTTLRAANRIAALASVARAVAITAVSERTAMRHMSSVSLWLKGGCQSRA